MKKKKKKKYPVCASWKNLLLTAVEEMGLQLPPEEGDGRSSLQLLWQSIPQHWGSICEGSSSVLPLASALSAGKTDPHLGS